jgi:hypothetical protein
MSQPSASPAGNSTNNRNLTLAIIALALLLPAVNCLFGDPVDDPDVWWHLSAGQWIVEHRAVPSTDTFSSHGVGKPWTAYSWIPEVMLYGLHRTLGLRGLLLFTVAFSIAILVAFHRLIRRLQPAGSLDAILVLTAALGLIPVMMPRPWLLSVLFFIIELDILLTASRRGDRRLLLWLIPLFVLWANSHIQFVMGLVVFGAAVAEALLVRVVPSRLVDGESGNVAFGSMLAMFVLCIGATLVNPYHVQLYWVAVQLVGQSQLWNIIHELLAMPFRSPCNWIVLAVTVGGAFAMGWKRKMHLFLVILFAMAVYFSFRSQRDVWFVLLVSLTVLAYCSPRETGRRIASSKAVEWAVPAVIGLAVVVGCLAVGETRLRRKIDETFPTRAIEFLASANYKGPMFNTFTWGGYLIYHLPQLPVSIDGRTMVHGEERVLRHYHTIRGDDGWQDDQELAQAQVVVLPRKDTLAALLKFDNRFCLVYEDSVAAVYSATGGHDS